MIYSNSNFRKKGGRDKKESRISPAGDGTIFLFHESFFRRERPLQKQRMRRRFSLLFRRWKFFRFHLISQLAPTTDATVSASMPLRGHRPYKGMPLSEPVRRAVGFGANAHFPFPMEDSAAGRIRLNDSFSTIHSSFPSPVTARCSCSSSRYSFSKLQLRL